MIDRLRLYIDEFKANTAPIGEGSDAYVIPAICAIALLVVALAIIG